MPIRIMIVDDVELARDAHRSLLSTQTDMIIVGNAEDGHDAVQMAESLVPDVIVMDISMPIMDGIEATRQICAKLPQAKIIMVSSISTRSYVQRSIKAGARGYVLKENMISEVVTAIRRVMKGQTYFGTGIRGRMEIESQVIDGNNVPLA